MPAFMEYSGESLRNSQKLHRPYYSVYYITIFPTSACNGSHNDREISSTHTAIAHNGL